PSPAALSTLSLHDALPIYLTALASSAALLVSVGTLAACGGGDSESDAEGLTTIRIGVAAPTAEQSLPQVAQELGFFEERGLRAEDRKSTRLNSSHVKSSYA